ncbi:MAG: HPr family phosphocarrier protein [Alphaproteobacteria bacterium]|nr:HPr family phosphocarrier protein [Rhodospirillales bacterium]MCW9046340.1 HPr family phosphocarrier protein [Alphaproteobacteria bacterium]
MSDIRIAEIKNQRGLHARAAAKFSKLAGTFDAVVEVSRIGQTVTGTSIMGLMMLAAAIGTEIEMTATGNQATEALDALETLVADKFGED